MNSLSIRIKILLLLCILGLIGIAGSLYSGLTMQSISSGYSSLIAHDSKASVLSARAERMLRVVMGTAYSLALETDESGNQQKLNVMELSQKDYRMTVAEVLKEAPARATDINTATALAEAAFKACAPLIKQAGESATPDQAYRAGSP